MMEQPRKGEVMKLQKLEKAWNNNVSLPSEPRRMTQMTQDIKHFIVRSMSDPIETQKLVESFQRERNQSTDALSKIFATFNFDHHDGTDQNLELRLIKVILVREGLLMSLKYCADKAKKNNSLEGNNLLELLAQLRESTLNYLEYLCLWRQSAIAQSSDQQLRPFYWEGGNYTMKIINDCDFLGENQVIIESLNLTQEQLRCNPLMLVNNLEDFNTWMPPAERAAMDTNNQTNTVEFQSRLRLRYAERILLQEMELNNFNGSEVFVTQNNETPTQGQQQGRLPRSQQDELDMGQELMVGSTALENEFEDDADDRDYNMINNNTNNTDHIYHTNNNNSERRVKTTESTSSSNRAIGSSNLQSRASTLSNGGFSSAPSTSHGSRGGGAAGGGGGVMLRNSTGGIEGGGGGFGHDFFTGHWAETPTSTTSSTAHPHAAAAQHQHLQGAGGAGPFFGRNNSNEDEQLQEQGSVIFVENGHPYQLQEDNQEDQEDDGQGSTRSLESIIRLSDIDFKVLANIPLPPKSLVLAASITVILLHKGESEVPTDATWSAFLRLTSVKRGFLPQISEEMAFLQANPQHIARFKLIAIEPLIEQLQERNNMRNLQKRELSSQELIAVNKLLVWVKRFSLSKINMKRSSGVEEDNEGNVRSPFKATMPITLSPIETMLRNKLIQKEKVKLSQTQTVQNLGLGSTGAGNKKSTQNKGKDGRVPTKPNKNLKSKTATTTDVGGASNRVKLIPKVNQELVVFHRVQMELSSAPGTTTGSGQQQQQMVVLTLLTSSDNTDTNTITTTASIEEEERVFALKDDLNPTDANPSRLLLKATVASVDNQPHPQPVKQTASNKQQVLQMAINMREYQLHYEDMLSKHGEETRLYYIPGDLRWWKNNITKFVTIFPMKNKALKMSLSKKAIDDYIHSSITTAHRLETPNGTGSNSGRRMSTIARGISPKNPPSISQALQQPQQQPLPVITESETATPKNETVGSSITQKSEAVKSLPKAAKKLDTALKSTRSIWKVGDYVEATSSDGFAFPARIVAVHDTSTASKEEQEEEYDVEYDDGEVLQHAKKKDITFLYSASDRTTEAVASPVIEDEDKEVVVERTVSSVYRDDFDGPVPAAAAAAAATASQAAAVTPATVVAVTAGAAIVATTAAVTSANNDKPSSQHIASSGLLASTRPAWKIGDYVEATNSDGFAFPARIVAVHDNSSDGQEDEYDVEYDDGEVMYNAKKKDITFLYSSSQRLPSQQTLTNANASASAAEEEDVVYVDDTEPVTAEPETAAVAPAVTAVKQDDDEAVIIEDEEASVATAIPVVEAESSQAQQEQEESSVIDADDDYSLDQPSTAPQPLEASTNKNVQFSENYESLSNHSSLLLTSTASIWKAGDFVEVNFNNGGMFYPGRIVNVHTEDDSYDIHYDDGDKQEHVARSLINFVASASKKLSAGSIAVPPAVVADVSGSMVDEQPPVVTEPSIAETPAVVTQAVTVTVKEVETATDSVIIEDPPVPAHDIFASNSIIEEQEVPHSTVVQALDSQEEVINEEPSTANLQTGAAALEEPSIASDYQSDFIPVHQQPSAMIGIGGGESIVEESGYAEDFSSCVVIAPAATIAPPLAAASASEVAEGSYVSDFTVVHSQPQEASVKKVPAVAVNASESYASDFDHQSAVAPHQQQVEPSASLVGTSQSYASDFHQADHPVITPREEEYSLILDEPSPFRAVPAPTPQDESMLEVSAMTIEPHVLSNLSSPDKNIIPPVVASTPSKAIAENDDDDDDDDEDLYFDDDLSEAVQAPLYNNTIEQSMSTSFSLKVGTHIEPGLATEGIIMTPLGMSSKPRQQFSPGAAKPVAIKETVMATTKAGLNKQKSDDDLFNHLDTEIFD